MKRTIACILWLAFTPLVFGQSSPQGLRVTGRVIGQSYCYGDGEVFTVPLNLDIRITNVSKKSYFVTSDMEAVANRVATSLEEAQRGNYIVEWHPTRYPDPANDEKKVRPITLTPSHSAVVHIAYAIVARFKDNPSIPGTVPSGKYVLQLELRTENGFAEQRNDDEAKGRIVTLKTEPISFEIPPNVTNPPECKN